MAKINLFKKIKEKIKALTTAHGKNELSVEDMKWNTTWDRWSRGEVESPYGELMTYQSEVYNGGTAQFFDNVSGTGDLEGTLRELYTVLPEPLCLALREAYTVFLIHGECKTDEDVEALDPVCDACDTAFYEAEEEINEILRRFSESQPI